MLNKLRQLILRPHLRAVLGQSAPRVTVEELFTRKRIVVVNLNRGLLGAEAARLLGSLLVGQLWSRLLARQALPPERRHVVSVYIDEAHDFINGLPGDLSEALAQARSLGGALHLTHPTRTTGPAGTSVPVRRQPPALRRPSRPNRAAATRPDQPHTADEPPPTPATEPTGRARPAGPYRPPTPIRTRDGSGDGPADTSPPLTGTREPLYTTETAAVEDGD